MIIGHWTHPVEVLRFEEINFPNISIAITVKLKTQSSESVIFIFCSGILFAIYCGNVRGFPIVSLDGM